jgi:hypothetical protein
MPDLPFFPFPRPGPSDSLAISGPLGGTFGLAVGAFQWGGPDVYVGYSIRCPRVPSRITLVLLRYQ